MITIHTKISDIDTEKWEKLVNSTPLATFFQTKDCYDFYSSLSIIKSFVFGVSENGDLKGIIVGYVVADGNLIKKFFSKRAIIPGGILLDNSISNEAINELLRITLHEISKKTIYIEFRNYNSYSNLKNIFESNGFKYYPHLNFHVSTPDLETAFNNLSSTKRRDIRVSKKEDAKWFESDSLVDLAEYYVLLSDLYKKKIKTPLFGYEFFEKIIKMPFCKFFVIKYNEKVIGGSICVLSPKTAVFEWFVCGLDGKYKNIYPSTLATWAAIEYAANNGYSRFDMMGAGKPEEGYGVREFKAKFGGELVEHGRFLYICNPFLYKIGKYIISRLRSKK